MRRIKFVLSQHARGIESLQHGGQDLAGCLDAIANGVIRNAGRLEVFLQRLVGLGTDGHHNSVHTAQLFLLAVLLHDDSIITDRLELAAGVDFQIRAGQPCHHGLQSANAHVAGDLRQHFYEQHLLALLQHERPQVIALIMAYMDPQQAAQILEQLPNEKRIPVLEGMANMSRVSPEAIAIVEEEMKRKFATIITSEDNMNLGGIDYVADVMNHVDRGNEKQIFDEMDKDNPELSKSIRDKMFMFENIIDMDPRSVQRFIRDCDSKDIVYALKTASEDMKNVFFANMSKRMAETVKGDLEITTNVRLKEVEEAQQRIVNLIRKLEDAGEVIINKGGDDDNIVV